MLTRALIVILVLLNASVALWWLLRSEPVVPDVTPPAGVAELQLLPAAGSLPTGSPDPSATALQDAASDAAPDAAVPAASAPAATPALRQAAATGAGPQDDAASPPAVQKPAAPRCIALGPFPGRSEAQAAQGRAGALLERSRLYEQPSPSSGGARYRVMLPPAASREAAQATVQRIVAAGLSDYYVIAQGPDANAIALGQYRNQEGAERRMAVLRAAGFQPQLQGGDAATTWWLRGALADGQSPDAVRQRSGAAQQRSLDCTRLR